MQKANYTLELLHAIGAKPESDGRFTLKLSDIQKLLDQHQAQQVKAIVGWRICDKDGNLSPDRHTFTPGADGSETPFTNPFLMGKCLDDANMTYPSVAPHNWKPIYELKDEPLPQPTAYHLLDKDDNITMGNNTFIPHIDGPAHPLKSPYLVQALLNIDQQFPERAPHRWAPSFINKNTEALYAQPPVAPPQPIKNKPFRMNP